MELAWAVLCRDVSVDATTNNISLFSLIDEVHTALTATQPGPIDAPPTLPLDFRIAVQWHRTDPGSPEVGWFRVRFRVSGAETPLLETPPQEVNLEKSLRSRTIVTVQGLPLATLEAGKHNYVVDIERQAGGDFVPCASIPLLVVIERRDDPEGGVPAPEQVEARTR